VRRVSRAGISISVAATDRERLLAIRANPDSRGNSPGSGIAISSRASGRRGTAVPSPCARSAGMPSHEIETNCLRADDRVTPASGTMR
jgi:hypothetical protein